jgi:hypothetical protein
MREGTRAVQIKHLLEHLTGLLAAAFAVLFVVGAAYCIVLLNTIGPEAFFHVTFTDVVNISIRAARLPLFIVLFIVFMITVLESACVRFNRLLYNTLSYVPYVVLLFYFVWRILLQPSVDGFVLLDLIRSSAGLLVSVLSFGVFISGIIWYSLPEPRRLRFFPVVLIPVIILADVSIRATGQAAQVTKCQPSDRLTYEGGAEEMDRDQVICGILSLERGLLLYDKEASGTIFIPWPHLTRVIQPAPTTLR